MPAKSMLAVRWSSETVLPAIPWAKGEQVHILQPRPFVTCIGAIQSNLWQKRWRKESRRDTRRCLSLLPPQARLTQFSAT